VGNQRTKVKVSRKRQRNFIVKKMRETAIPKIHLSAKDREKQKKWRFQSDPSGDYEQLDDWLME
jgi:ribosomal 50S subunit-associated protein YjgA (DUF615 family)